MVLEKLRRAFGKNPEDMSEDQLYSRVMVMFSKVYSESSHKLEDVMDLEEARFYLRKHGWKEKISLTLIPPEDKDASA